MKSQSRNVYLNLGMAWRTKNPQRLDDQTTLRTLGKQSLRAQHGSERPTLMNIKNILNMLRKRLNVNNSNEDSFILFKTTMLKM